MFPSKFATWPDDAKWSSSVMSRASKRQRILTSVKFGLRNKISIFSLQKASPIHNVEKHTCQDLVATGASFRCKP